MNVMADMQSASYQMLAELGLEIMTMPEARLRIRAAGLSYRSGSNGNIMVDASDAVSAAEIRVALSELLHRDKQQFFEAWKDENGYVRGLIRYGIEVGVIVAQKNSNQAETWKWSDADGGGDIITVPRNSEPLISLFNHAGESYNYFIPKLRDAIARVEGASIQMPGAFEEIVNEEELTVNKVKALEPDALVRYSASLDVIWFDRSAGQVYRMNAEGETEGDPLYSVQNKKEWQKEYAEFIAQPLNVNSLKMLRQYTNEKKFGKAAAIFGQKEKK